MQLVEIPIEESFKALGDTTRLRILRLLATTDEEACLCELVDSLLEPQYKLSRHLKILRSAGLLTAEKDGRWVYHRLVRGPDYLKAIFRVVTELPDAGGIFAADHARFQTRLDYREGGRCRTGVLTEALQSESG